MFWIWSRSNWNKMDLVQKLWIQYLLKQPCGRWMRDTNIQSMKRQQQKRRWLRVQCIFRRRVLNSKTQLNNKKTRCHWMWKIRWIKRGRMGRLKPAGPGNLVCVIKRFSIHCAVPQNTLLRCYNCSWFFDYAIRNWWWIVLSGLGWRIEEEGRGKWWVWD